MRRSLHLASVTLVALLGSRVARAEGTDVTFVPSTTPHEIVIDTPGERTTLNIVAISVTAGLGLVVGAGGLYYNLQARSNASDLSSAGIAGVTWDAAHETKQSNLHSDNVGMVVGYSVGGALLVGAAIALMVTAPSDTSSVIHPRTGGLPVIAPTAGGALVGGRWSF